MDDMELKRQIEREVLRAMEKRCIEEGHAWENGCTVFFELVKICKWCGERVPMV